MGVNSMTDSISAKVVADSLSPEGKRITTFELEYHRYILAELNTHAMTARNTASCRAIPIQRMIDLVMEQPVNPVEWGRNRAGMQASETLDETESKLAEHVWDDARRAAVRYATDLMNLGLHKQVVNRLLEPFQKAKTVLTATELNNFFTLRLHSAAQPEIRVLAERMKEAMDASTPNRLQYGNGTHRTLILVSGLQQFTPSVLKTLWPSVLRAAHKCRTASLTSPSRKPVTFTTNWLPANQFTLPLSPTAPHQSRVILNKV